MINQFINYGDKLNTCLTIVDLNLPDRPLIYVNKIFENLSEYKSEDIIGKNCRFLQGEDTNPKHVENIRMAINNGYPIFQDILNYTKSKKPFLNRLILFPIISENESYFIGIQNQLEKGDKAKSRSFNTPDVDISTISHDLRNILNRVLGSLYIMDKSSEEEKKKKYEEFVSQGLIELKDFVLSF